MIVDTTKGKVFCEFRKGDPLVVFIHGAGCNSTLWKDVIDNLDYSVGYLLIDLPGHGKSTDAKMVESIEGYGDVVIEVVGKLNVENFVLSGHSMGGAIVLELMSRSLSEVKAGIVISSGATLKVNPLVIDGLKVSLSETLEKISKWAISRDSDSEILKRVFSIFSSCDVSVIISDFVACDNFDIRDKLNLIDKPLLVVVGSSDVMTPHSLSKEIVDRVEFARFVVIDGKGHMLPIESPKELANIIEEFIKEI